MVHTYINKRSFMTSADKIFEMIMDAEKWPEFIKDCIEVKILERKKNECIRYMKSKVNHKICEMKTKCFYDTKNRKMEFLQLKSPWPIKTNSGIWYVKEITNEKVEMVLIHKVEARYGIIGDFFMHFIIGKYFIFNHAEKILETFEKEIGENRNEIY